MCIRDSYNADADIADDSLCEYALVQGCTDEAACNYDAAAEQDNGSCELPAEGYDCDGNCLSGTLVSVSNDGYPSEVSWSITGCDGSELISGGAPFAGCADLSGGYSVSMSDSWGDGWSGAVISVEDAAYSLASGSSAEDIATCAVPGCTDSTATNYNSAANVDDDSCEYAIAQGCTDTLACNFDADAIVDDASCTYAAAGQDCAGNCLNGGTSVEYTAGGFPGENSFNITDCDGNVLAEMADGSVGFSDACVLLPEIYTINLVDSWGDSWNGGNLNVDGVDYTVDALAATGATFSVGSCPVYGCTDTLGANYNACLLYTSPSPRDATLSRMPSSA